MYYIYFRGLVKALTPSFLRKNELLAFLYAISKPLQTLNDDLITPWRERTQRLVTFDGTTIMLEKMLNDFYMITYDPNQREADIALTAIIYIENSSDTSLWYLYNDSENRDPRYLYNASEGETPLYLFNESEFGTTPKFTVWIPNLLGGTYETANTDDNLKLRKLVDTFRFGSFYNYLIKRY